MSVEAYLKPQDVISDQVFDPAARFRPCPELKALILSRYPSIREFARRIKTNEVSVHQVIAGQRAVVASGGGMAGNWTLIAVKISKGLGIPAKRLFPWAVEFKKPLRERALSPTLDEGQVARVRDMAWALTGNESRKYPADQFRYENVQMAMDEALVGFPRTDRRIIRMKFFEGKTYGEIGDILGISPQAVRLREASILRRLRNPAILKRLEDAMADRVEADQDVSGDSPVVAPAPVSSSYVGWYRRALFVEAGPGRKRNREEAWEDMFGEIPGRNPLREEWTVKKDWRSDGVDITKGVKRRMRMPVEVKEADRWAAPAKCYQCGRGLGIKPIIGSPGRFYCSICGKEMAGTLKGQRDKLVQ